MPVNRSHETVPAHGFLLLIIAEVVSSWSALGRADVTERERTSHFARPDVETIRMYTRQVLSDPALASRKTLWQWFKEKVAHWNRPRFEPGSGWATFIWFVVLIWCILTLLAILAHLIWTVRLMIWPNRRRQNATAGPGSEPVKIISFDKLYNIARELAEKGAFSEAISVMMVALLRLLDCAGVVGFHESKTNEDYVREYPPGVGGRNEFGQFVIVVERTVYGRFPCDHQTYWQANSLMERIRNCVTGKA